MKPIQSFREFCREAMNAPTDAQGNLLRTFTSTVSELIDELSDLQDTYDTVEVTPDDDAPGIVLMKFLRRARL
jgi:hypothetical protein